MKIVATVCATNQVGVSEYRDIRISRVFDESRSIRDILQWAKSTLGTDNISFCDILISDYTGESI